MFRHILFRASLLLVFLGFSHCAFSQTLETSEKFPTGYITVSHFSESNTIKSIDGVLYMLVNDTPMTLLKYPPMNPREEFEVPSTVRRICANAFQGTKYLKTLKLHNYVSSGTYLQLTIADNAFVDSSIENFVVIENDVTALHEETPVAKPVSREVVGRYDLAGRRVDAHTDGIQIVQYDDHSSVKVKN